MLTNINGRKKEISHLFPSVRIGLYESDDGLGHENHREQGSLPATIKTLRAVRESRNFVSFSWIGYNIYHQDDPRMKFNMKHV